MQRAISTRIDETVYQIIERIVLFAVSFGSWKRDESTEETIKSARSTFNYSMVRHHDGKK
jgi:hypothetical protein